MTAIKVFEDINHNASRTDVESECTASQIVVYPIAMIISCVLLAATMAVHFTLSELRNRPGKIVICLSFSLCLAYLALVTDQLLGNSQLMNCKAICFATGLSS